MSAEVRTLEPTQLWNHFADLNAVPRASKKEQRVIQFMVNFGKSLGLPVVVDDIGNVIIKKPASKGMEGRKIVVLQSHLDMVHQKNASTNFNFDTDGIQMFVEGDWVKATGTTLGADNGIGVATIMSILASTDIAHPAIEALFTIDEETGMTGALGLKGGLLNGSILLNLDTEDDDELTIGCAGGVDVTATGKYGSEPAGSGIESWTIAINGLTGGHSGMDIHRGRANANKLMNRLLWNLAGKFGVRIHSINGGSLRNAIPRESFALVAVPNQHAAEAKKYIQQFETTLKSEYRDTDPNLAMAITSTTAITTVISSAFQQQLLNAIYSCPIGIYRMSSQIEGLVQTSNNLARVLVGDGSYSIQCLTRSSVDSEKMDEADMIRSVFQQIGATVEYGGSYPGWTPDASADIVRVMSDTYKKMFGADAHVMACHAGLECGILGTNYPDMEMISFGPNIKGAHSPDEKVQIISVQKFWKFLLETLKQTPVA